MVVFTTGHHGHRVRAHCDYREVEGMLFEEGEHVDSDSLGLEVKDTKKR